MFLLPYLTPEPSTATRGHVLLNEGNADVRVLGQLIGTGETSRSSSHNNNIDFSIFVHVMEVAGRHGTRDLRLADGFKCVAIVRSSVPAN